MPHKPFAHRIFSMSGVILAFVLTLSTHANALTLDIDGLGQLQGASEVLVGTTLYDVAFVDGSCIALFSGCDGPEDFLLDRAAAEMAAQALLTQVFLDSPLGQFDSMPALTNGCEFTGTCTSVIPYTIRGTLVFSWNAGNNSGLRDDEMSMGLGDLDGNTGIAQSQMYAVFTESVGPTVPEPSTILLFGSGLAGLIGWQLRKKTL